MKKRHNLSNLEKIVRKAKTVYLYSPSIISPRVLEALFKSFKFRKLVYLFPEKNTQDPRLIRGLLEVQLFLLDNSIPLELKEIEKFKGEKKPQRYCEYLKGKLLIKNKHSDQSQKIPLKRKNYRESDRKYTRELDIALKRIFKEQTWARFQHTIRVFKFAYNLAISLKLSKEELERLSTACIYHDLAKTWKRAKLFKYALQIYSTTREELVKELWWLHGPVAKKYLEKLNPKKQRKKLTKEILEAIEHHSRPIVSENILLKILIIADKMEPKKEKNFSTERYQQLLTTLSSGKKEDLERVYSYFLSKPTKQLYT